MKKSKFISQRAFFYFVVVMIVFFSLISCDKNSYEINDLFIEGTSYQYTSMVNVLDAIETVVGNNDNWAVYNSIHCSSKHRGVFIKDTSFELIPYNIGRYEVTQQFYERIMNKVFDYDFGDSDYIPTYNVSFYDAIAFCNKLSLMTDKTPCYSIKGVNFANLSYDDIPKKNNNKWNAVVVNADADGYRLPTEVEWEFAARGGAQDELDWFYAFSGINMSDVGGNIGLYRCTADENLEQVGWYVMNSDGEVHPVGQKQPNRLDVYDMSGNLYEWCYDFYYRDTGKSDIDEKLKYNRVLRGGAWNRGAGRCSVSYRASGLPYARLKNYGLRLVSNAN